MGKVTTPSNFSTVKTWEDLRRFAAQLCQDIVNQINGGLTFKDNIQNTELSAFFPLADKDVALTHTLGYVPSGFLVVGLDSAAIIYNSTAANANQIFLKSSVASVTAKVRVF